MSIVERRLGLYERYHVARSNVGKGFHPTIILGTAISFSPKDIDVPKAAVDAIAVLLSKYPMLSCVIADHRTREPKYARTSVRAEDIFSVPVIKDDLNLSGGNGSRAIVERVTLDGVNEPGWELDRAPLWRVAWYPGENPNEGALVLTAHHVLCDGRGVLVLFRELLSLMTTPQPTVGLKNAELPPSLDSTVNLKPGLRTLLGVLFNEFVRPLVPAFLLPTPLPSWPPPSSKPTFTCPATGKTVFFSQDVVNAVKNAGKARGIKTLQPILMACALCALHQVIAQSPSALKSIAKMEIGSETARSLRDPGLGHPDTTGNYVAAHNHSFIIKPTQLPALSSIWESAKTYAASLSSPSSLAADISNMGMLAYIPDPPVEEGANTGWEEWLIKRSKTDKPFRACLEMSNLGVAPGTSLAGVNVEGLWFAQNPGPLTAAIGMNVASYPGTGMGIWIMWREGAVDDETVQSFVETFERLFKKIAEDNADKGTA